MSDERDEVERGQRRGDPRGRRIHTHAGQPIRTHTKLGRYLVDNGFRVSDASALSGVYSRTLSDYLRGEPIRPQHLIALADGLGCEPEEIDGLCDE